MFSSSAGTEASSMCIWKSGFFPSAMRLAVASISGFRKLVDRLRVAVIGVEADQHVILLGEKMGGFGQHDAAERGILDGQCRRRTGRRRSRTG